MNIRTLISSTPLAYPDIKRWSSGNLILLILLAGYPDRTHDLRKQVSVGKRIGEYFFSKNDEQEEEALKALFISSPNNYRTLLLFKNYT